MYRIVLLYSDPKFYMQSPYSPRNISRDMWSYELVDLPMCVLALLIADIRLAFVLEICVLLLEIGGVEGFSDGSCD